MEDSYQALIKELEDTPTREDNASSIRGMITSMVHKLDEFASSEAFRCRKPEAYAPSDAHIADLAKQRGANQPEEVTSLTIKALMDSSLWESNQERMTKLKAFRETLLLKASEIDGSVKAHKSKEKSTRNVQRIRELLEARDGVSEVALKSLSTVTVNANDAALATIFGPQGIRYRVERRYCVVLERQRLSKTITIQGGVTKDVESAADFIEFGDFSKQKLILDGGSAREIIGAGGAELRRIEKRFDVILVVDGKVGDESNLYAYGLKERVEKCLEYTRTLRDTSAYVTQIVCPWWKAKALITVLSTERQQLEVDHQVKLAVQGNEDPAKIRIKGNRDHSAIVQNKVNELLEEVGVHYLNTSEYALEQINKHSSAPTGDSSLDVAAEFHRLRRESGVTTFTDKTLTDNTAPWLAIIGRHKNLDEYKEKFVTLLSKAEKGVTKPVIDANIVKFLNDADLEYLTEKTGVMFAFALVGRRSIIELWGLDEERSAAEHVLNDYIKETVTKKQRKVEDKYALWYLLNDSRRYLQLVQSKHNVLVDLDRESGELTITGRGGDVDGADLYIAEIEAGVSVLERRIMETAATNVKMVVGKQGRTMKGIKEETRVELLVFTDSPDNTGVSEIHLLGTEETVNAAERQIHQILERNDARPAPVQKKKVQAKPEASSKPVEEPAEMKSEVHFPSLPKSKKK